MGSDRELRAEEEIANQAYDAHLEAGDAMDSLLSVDWEKQPDYGEWCVETAIEGFEEALDHLESLQGEINE